LAHHFLAKLTADFQAKFRPRAVGTDDPSFKDCQEATHHFQPVNRQQESSSPCDRPINRTHNRSRSSYPPLSESGALFTVQRPPNFFATLLKLRYPEMVVLGSGADYIKSEPEEVSPNCGPPSAPFRSLSTVIASPLSPPSSQPIPMCECGDSAAEEQNVGYGNPENMYRMMYVCPRLGGKRCEYLKYKDEDEPCIKQESDSLHDVRKTTRETNSPSRLPLNTSNFTARASFASNWNVPLQLPQTR
jgi:hypothetical protein